MAEASNELPVLAEKSPTSDGLLWDKIANRTQIEYNLPVAFQTSILTFLVWPLKLSRMPTKSYLPWHSQVS
jgi:hypothetical protein